MHSDSSITERRKFKRHKVKGRPIAVLGPKPIRVGHVDVMSHGAAQISYSTNNGFETSAFSELVILSSDYNRTVNSGRIDVKTISDIPLDNFNTIFHSRMRRCVIKFNRLNLDQRRKLDSLMQR